MMILFTALLGVLLTVFGVVFMEPVGAISRRNAGNAGRLRALWTDRHCVHGAFMLQNVFQSFLIAAEKPKLGLAATVAAGVTNMALDALFVAGFHWGIAGAATARA